MNYPAAAEQLRKSEEVLQKEVGGDHLRMAKCQETLAELLLADNKLPEAEKASRRAYAIRMAKLKAPHPEIAKAMDQLERILKAQHRDDAEILITESKQMLKLHADQEEAAPGATQRG